MGLSKTEYLVLHFLRSGREFYLLELVRESNGALKASSTKAMLRQMTLKKYLTSRAEDIASNPGARKRLYQIGSLGEAALREEEQSPLEGSGCTRRA